MVPFLNLLLCGGRGFYAPTGLLGEFIDTSNLALATWRTTNEVAHNDKRTDFAELVDWGHKVFKL